MSGMVLNLNSSIIGVSFLGINMAKRQIYRAKESAQDEKRNLSKAIDSLKVQDGRLRMSADTLRDCYSRINQKINRLEQTSEYLDYVVKRFKETDEFCADKIKSNGYDYRKSIGLVAEGGIFTNLVSGVVSIVDKAKDAWNGLKDTVVDFYEENKVLINNIATIAVEGLTVALTAAAIVAGTVTGVGLVVAVAGGVFALSNLIDSGVKVYNYTKTGEEIGFNPLKKGFQVVLGDEAGETVYNVASIATQVADIAVSGVALVKAGIRIKNTMKTGKTFKEALKIVKGAGKPSAVGDVIQEGIEGATKNADDVAGVVKGERILDDVVEGASEVGIKPTTNISSEMQNKILEGQRKSLTRNEVIGGHSPNINNQNPNFAVEELSVNPDGTRNVKFTKDLLDGNISKLKKSTLFPDSWSESKIIDSVKQVGDSPAISTRLRDGATWH
ncbi:MAG: EndoU domain-containing protein, partial [Candidatus Pelagibacter ubique]